MPSRFLGLCARISGARARVVGIPLRRDSVILANHVSWLDILLLAGTADAIFVTKAEIARTPLVGWLASLNDTTFIDRAARSAIGEQVDAIRRALGPRPVALFPEGTTGDGVMLLPFKSALLASLDPPPPGIQVQPVRIDYGVATPDIAWVGNEPGLRNIRRVLSRRSFDVTLYFAQPITPEGTRKDIAAEARSRIEAA
jgi:1-acyl-sn-glycerol-3-phosphate acyltransferase